MLQSTQYVCTIKSNNATAISLDSEQRKKRENYNYPQI